MWTVTSGTETDTDYEAGNAGTSAIKAVKKVDSTKDQREGMKDKYQKLSRTVLNYQNSYVMLSDSESSEDEGQIMPSLLSIRS